MTRLTRHLVLICLLLGNSGAALFGSAQWILCVGEDGHIGIKSPHGCCEDDESGPILVAGDHKPCCVDTLVATDATAAIQKKHNEKARLLPSLAAPVIQQAYCFDPANFRRDSLPGFALPTSDVMRLQSVILQV